MNEIKNLKKTAQRIEKAIKNKERILIFADSDLDGITSCIVLEETIKSLGGKIQDFYFFGRTIEEAYGLNEDALKYFKKSAPALLITLDCGITSFEEIEMANKLGFETIVIDHHQVLDKLPRASIIVDPKQKQDKYPFKELAAVGVVCHLSRLLFKDKWNGGIKKNIMELTALGTLADMMKISDDNEEFIKQGLPALINSPRPAFQALLNKIGKDEYSHNEIIRKIIGILNITEMENHVPQSYSFLTCSDKSLCQKTIEKLCKQNQERKLRVRNTTEVLMERINEQWPVSVIFEGGGDCTLNITGALSSRLCNKFQKPCFIFEKGNKISKGSVRTPKGIDSVKAMKQCSDLLVTFGGHAQASGFTVENKNLKKFKKCLSDYFSKLN